MINYLHIRKNVAREDIFALFNAIHVNFNEFSLQFDIMQETKIFFVPYVISLYDI